MVLDPDMTDPNAPAFAWPPPHWAPQEQLAEYNTLGGVLSGVQPGAPAAPIPAAPPTEAPAPEARRPMPAPVASSPGPVAIPVQPTPGFIPPSSWGGAPDAVSGGTTSEQTGDEEMQRLGVHTEESPEDFQKRTAFEQQKKYVDAAQEAIAKGDIDALHGAVIDMDPEARKGFMARMDPIAYAGLAAKQDMIRQNETADRMLEEQKRQAAARDAEWRETQRIYAQASADTAAMVQRAKALAAQEIDPRAEVKRMGIAGNIGMALASIVGGASGGYLGTGRNVAMEQFNKNIESNIAAQRDAISNQWKGVDTDRNAIADELARHNDMNHAAATYRVAGHEAFIQQLQTEQQKYDPNGVTAGMHLQDAINQARAQQQKAINDDEARRIKNAKDQADAMKAMAEAQKAAAEAAKLKAAMGGGATGPGGAGSKGYPVALGIDNPFAAGEQLFGRYKLQPTQHAQLLSNNEEYAKEQNDLAELRQLGEGAHWDKETLAEKIGAGSTEAALFNAVRGRYMLRIAGRHRLGAGGEEGGKAANLTSEAIESQVPSLQGWLSQKDPKKLIDLMQQDSDRSHATFLRGIGVDESKIIGRAQTMRKEAPEPATKTALAEATEGVATARTETEKKSAEKGLEKRREKLEAELAEGNRGEQARKDIEAGKWTRQSVRDQPLAGEDPTVASHFELVRAAQRQMNLKLDEYDAAKGKKVPTAKSKGEQDVAQRRYDDAVRDAALGVDGAGRALESARKAAVEELGL